MRRKVLPKKVKASKTVTVYRIRIVPDNEPYDHGDSPQEDIDADNEAVEREGLWGFVIEVRKVRGAFHTDWEDMEGVNSVWGFIGWQFCLDDAISCLPKDAVYTVEQGV
jgi:hypothetical protein